MLLPFRKTHWCSASSEWWWWWCQGHVQRPACMHARTLFVGLSWKPAVLEFLLQAETYYSMSSGWLLAQGVDRCCVLSALSAASLLLLPQVDAGVCCTA